MRAPAPCSAPAGELVLFYHITPIADPQRDAATLHTLCTQLGVCGRLRVCADGLNGTLSGARASLAGLRAHIAQEYPHGHAIDWKMSPVETPHQLFRALSVRVTRSPPPTSPPPNLPLTPPLPPLTPLPPLPPPLPLPPESLFRSASILRRLPSRGGRPTCRHGSSMSLLKVLLFKRVHKETRHRSRYYLM